MPNKDFDIDHLKSAWQNQKIEDAYNQTEIEIMLNKKSKNYIKYILWISVIEFLLFTWLNFASFFYNNNNHESFRGILSKLHIKNQEEVLSSLDEIYLVMKILSVIMTGIFVILFYRSYKKINIEENLKQFINQIISFKNKVNAFIACNIILLVSYVIAFSVYLSIVAGRQSIELNNPTLMGVIIGFILALLLISILLVLYYKLVYGILLGRLSKNMKQLQQIELERESQ